jgi:hypothetical protein
MEIDTGQDLAMAEQWWNSYLAQQPSTGSA